MYNDYVQIPFSYRHINENSHNLEINSHEISLVKIPVSESYGDILIPEIKTDNYYIPESISTAHKGFANIEIHNYSDQNSIVKFKDPLKVTPISEETHELFNVETITHKSQSTRNDININNLIRTEHLNLEEKQKLTKLCSEFSDIFHKDGDNLTFTNAVKHEIKTTDETPVYSKSYRYPFVHKTEVQRQINDMLENGIIRPSISPWSSPI